MRLLFLCSGLERGRDGVGDYTRTLANACAGLGHAVAVVSVRDAQAADGAPPHPAAGQLGEWRLRDLFAHPSTAEKFRSWTAAFAPDWVSVQHSAFGFHPRGLGAGRAAQLRALLPPASRRHLMLHELWIERTHGQPLRHSLLGWLQHRVFRAWLGRAFRPTLTHAQCRWYQQQLRAFGFAVGVFPLCSNIPVLPAPAGDAWLRSRVQASGPLPPPDTAYWLGHFGSLYTEEFSPRAFLENLSPAVRAAGKQLVAIALGHLRTGREAWAALTQSPPPNVTIASLPELSIGDVSHAMASCDAAFCTTPWHLVEKSSAAAAWRAHAVPVLTPRSGGRRARRFALEPWSDAGLLPAYDLPLRLPPHRMVGPAQLQPTHSAADLLAQFSGMDALGLSL